MIDLFLIYGKGFGVQDGMVRLHLVHSERVEMERRTVNVGKASMIYGIYRMQSTNYDSI